MAEISPDLSHQRPTSAVVQLAILGENLWSEKELPVPPVERNARGHVLVRPLA